jgi:prolyl-tRNA synthetase
MLGERVIFQDAYAMGLSVSEAEPSGKAAEEIQHLYKYICSILGISTSRRGEDEKAERTSKRVA